MHAQEDRCFTSSSLSRCIITVRTVNTSSQEICSRKASASWIFWACIGSTLCLRRHAKVILCTMFLLNNSEDVCILRMTWSKTFSCLSSISEWNEPSCDAVEQMFEITQSCDTESASTTGHLSSIILSVGSPTLKAVFWSCRAALRGAFCISRFPTIQCQFRHFAMTILVTCAI